MRMHTRLIIALAMLAIFATANDVSWTSINSGGLSSKTNSGGISSTLGEAFAGSTVSDGFSIEVGFQHWIALGDVPVQLALILPHPQASDFSAVTKSGKVVEICRLSGSVIASLPAGLSEPELKQRVQMLPPAYYVLRFGSERMVVSPAMIGR